MYYIFDGFYVSLIGVLGMFVVLNLYMIIVSVVLYIFIVIVMVEVIKIKYCN